MMETSSRRIRNPIHPTKKREGKFSKSMLPVLLLLLPCTVAVRLWMHLADTAESTTTGTRVQVAIPKHLTEEARIQEIYLKNKAAMQKSRKEDDDVDKQDTTHAGDQQIDAACRGKEEFLPILEQALGHILDDCPSHETLEQARQQLRGVPVVFGVTTCRVQDLCPQLGVGTMWQHVVDQYFFKNIEDKKGIRVIGMNTCSAFREGLLPKDPKDGTILEPSARLAGLFHSGLEIAAETLYNNHLLSNLEDGDKAWQVPWGKHTPVQFKTSDIYKDSESEWKRILPVVVVRDPFRWMNSLCAARDQAFEFVNSESSPNCPSLVTLSQGTATGSNATKPEVIANKVKVVWHPEQYPQAVTEEFNSLGDLWTQWYNEYFAADFPRLIVRYEDILFYPDEVLDVVATCMGTEVVHPSRLTLHTSGKNGGQDDANDLIHAIKKHGSTLTRTEYMTKEDLEYAQIAMADSMDWFGYQTNFEPSL